MNCPERFHTGLDVSRGYHNYAVYNLHNRTVFLSLLCIVLLMYLNLASLSPGESKTALLTFASLDHLISG